MSQINRTKLIKIGNSRGIRIPKSVIERLHLDDEIELVIKEDHIEVRAGRKPRDGWDEAFSSMAERKDDQLMDEPAPTAWDEKEWEW